MAEINRLRGRDDFLLVETGDGQSFIQRAIPRKWQEQLHFDGHFDTDPSEERAIACVECSEQRSLKRHTSTRLRVNHKLKCHGAQNCFCIAIMDSALAR